MNNVIMWYFLNSLLMLLGFLTVCISKVVNCSAHLSYTGCWNTHKCKNIPLALLVFFWCFLLDVLGKTATLRQSIACKSVNFIQCQFGNNQMASSYISSTEIHEIMKIYIYNTINYTFNWYTLLFIHRFFAAFQNP